MSHPSARLGGLSSGAKLGGIGGAKLGGIAKPAGLKPSDHDELADKMGALTTKVEGEHINALKAVASTMKDIAQSVQGLSEKNFAGFPRSV